MFWQNPGKNDRCLTTADRYTRPPIRTLTVRSSLSLYNFCVLLDPGPEPAVFGDPADKAAWRAANDGATTLREALQSIHDIPLPSGPLPNRRVGQILVKAANRPVRAGEKTVRLRPVHKGHAGRTYQLEAL